MLMRSFEEERASGLGKVARQKSATFTGKTPREKTRNAILFGEPDKQAHPVVNAQVNPSLFRSTPRVFAPGGAALDFYSGNRPDYRPR
jgi:hypothetical protein